MDPGRGRKPAVSEPGYDLEYLQGGQRTCAAAAAGGPRQPGDYAALPAGHLSTGQGEIVTTATYANYLPIGTEQFPRLVTITRPLDELSLTIQVTKLALNETFDADQFELEIPANVAVTRMD